MPKSPDLILITGSKSTKPCAVAEIAALEFEPLLSGLSQKQRLRRVRELVDVVGTAAAVASEMVTKTKAELIAMAQEKHEECGASLMEFAHIKESAHMLASIIQGAELRLAVALANVEKDGRPGDRVKLDALPRVPDLKGDRSEDPHREAQTQSPPGWTERFTYGDDLRPLSIEYRKGRLGKLVQPARRSQTDITLNKHCEGDGAVENKLERWEVAGKLYREVVGG